MDLGKGVECRGAGVGTWVGTDGRTRRQIVKKLLIRETVKIQYENK